VREICTPGSAWENEHKSLRRPGEALARKGQLQRGSAKATAPRFVPTSHRVNHDRLLARLAQRVADHRLLRLIRLMLKAKVVLPDGVVVQTEKGTPQGALSS
jgi:hypothetical protein